ncbi:hypothetical protein GCM10017624_14540 [Azotobacter vinelandii]|nr:hypothetical protein GCM10017624_14540 [Azotobacter vinelandii]
MSGRAFSLVTFSLREQRESDSPYKAKPVVSAEESIRLGTKPSRQFPKNPPLQAGKTYRSDAEAREARRSRGRMSGRAFSLVTFSLREQRESDSPYKAKPVVSAGESIRLGTKPSRQLPKNPPLQAGKTYRSDAEAREVRRSRGRMTGRAFSLVTFSLREQRESDSPYKAKPVVSAEESIRLGTKPSRQLPKNPPLQAGKAYRSGTEAPEYQRRLAPQGTPIDDLP